MVVEDQTHHSKNEVENSALTGTLLIVCDYFCCMSVVAARIKITT